MELVELSPFSVFCAILGVTETDGYARQEHAAVARRFQMSDQDLSDYLDEHGLTTGDLCDGSFDLEGARLDIKVAPEGISRVELARTLYEEFRAEQDGVG